MFKINFPFINKRSFITLDNFLQNPSGVGASYGGSRERIREELRMRYNNLLFKYKKFDFDIYKEDDKKFVFVFKIPSETIDNFFYDVVLEFIEDSPDARKGRTINHHSMNFFSNSPDMMFTYTYVLNDNKILVDWLRKPRCSKRAIRDKPRVRNPVEQFGFEKSCYYAAYYIKNRQLNLKSDIINNAKDIDRRIKINIINSISSQDKKLDEYNKMKKLKKTK